MRNLKKIFALFIVTAFVACRKEDPINIPADYRDAVVGTYDGIKIYTTFQDTIVGYNHDTTNVSIQLKKSSLDSIVDLCFGPTYENISSSFKFSEGNFIPTDNYHAPSLAVTGDSLIMHHQPGLGYAWYDYFAKKTE